MNSVDRTGHVSALWMLKGYLWRRGVSFKQEVFGSIQGDGGNKGAGF